MIGMTDFITEACWEDVFIHWFILVDDAYQTLERHYGSWRRSGPQPTFQDSEVITVGLIIDTWFGGDEAKGLAFLRQYHADLFPALPANGHFNARRQALRLIIEQIRRCLLNSFGLVNPADPQRLIDSAPLPVCSYGRAARCNSVAGPEYVGHMATKKAKFFGFRLQVTVTTQQVVEDWMLAPAAHKDGKMTHALLSEAHDLILFGDNAYRDPWEKQLLLKHNIQLYAPPRKDSRERPWPKRVLRLFRRLRLQVETAFSVLTVVFEIQRPGSRSLGGVITRTASRLLAYTLCFLTTPLFVFGEISKTPN